MYQVYFKNINKINKTKIKFSIQSWIYAKKISSMLFIRVEYVLHK